MPEPVAKATRTPRDRSARINAAFDKLAQTIQTKETDKGMAMFSRSPDTQASYEARVLNASDVMGLLGYPRAPLILNESHLREGGDDGGSLEEGARLDREPSGGVFRPARHGVADHGRSRGGGGVPGDDGDRAQAHTSVARSRRAVSTAGDGPRQDHWRAAGFLASNGHLKYVHTQNAPGIWQSAGVQFPRQSALLQGRGRILTEKHLAGYRRANPAFSFADAEAGEVADTRTAERQASDARLVAAQQLVDGIRERWKRSPEIIVARNMQDPQVPQRVRDYDAQLKSQGSDGQARGFIYQGKVYLLSDELNGPAQIAEVLFHEVLGHWGLRGVFGERLTPILQQIGTMRRAAVVAKAREYGLVNAEALADQGVDLDSASDRQVWAAMSPRNRLSAAEEVLAEMAQATPEVGFVRRAIAAIRTWLRENVPGFGRMALTDDEIIRSYLLPARGYVTRSDETPEQSLQRAMLAFSRGPGDGNAGDAVAAGDAQFRETERAYGGRDAYERAKAAGRTKLTYGQWVQVRTPNFKRWFGDWQALAAQQRLDAMEPVQVRVPQEWRGLPVRELRELVEASLLELMASGEPLKHPEVGEVQVVRKGIKKALSSGADPAKLQVLGDLRNAFGSSFLAGTQAAQGEGPNVLAYDKLLARLEVGGTEVVAVFTVRRLSDGTQFYSTVTLEDGQKKTPVASPRDTPIAGERATSANTRVSDFVRRPLQRVNPDSLSKAVDPQTGEPVVVYHGTAADITKFAPEKSADAVFHFAVNADTANRFAESRASDGVRGANEMPVYLAIKNPKRMPFINTFGVVSENGK